MPYDYSVLFQSEDGISNTWREFYDDSQLLSLNVLSILKKLVYLPYDMYDIVTAYLMLPSALCKVLPYLFFYGQSGSGKSTIAKFAAHLHGARINSSSDTFAGIRNDLEKKRRTYVEIEHPEYPTGTCQKSVERNFSMVWDDVDASVFTNSPDLYRLFKFGYDRSTDKILISSKEVGENLEFHCFSPKIFSSISPLHLNDAFRELRRRLIVVPCKRVEELTPMRKAKLGITDDNWQDNLIDLDAYDWRGFNTEFDEFWDLDTAEAFVTARKIIASSTRGLSSQQRAISLDLLACGIASGIWLDEKVAVNRVKEYWQWFKSETEQGANLTSLLKEYIKQHQVNANAASTELELPTISIRNQVDMWVSLGWLYERPKGSQVNEAMLALGMRLQKGRWIKS